MILRRLAASPRRRPVRRPGPRRRGADLEGRRRPRQDHAGQADVDVRLRRPHQARRGHAHRPVGQGARPRRPRRQARRPGHDGPRRHPARPVRRPSAPTSRRSTSCRANASVLAVSHTHTGPVVGSNLRAMYFLDETQQQLRRRLRRDAARRSWWTWSARRSTTWRPAELALGQRPRHLRRQPPQQQGSRRAEAARAGRSSRGRSITTCRCCAVRDQQGKLRAVVFGYACHATVLSVLPVVRRLPRLRADGAGEGPPRRGGAVLGRLRRRPEPAAAPHASSWPRSTASNWPTASRRCWPSRWRRSQASLRAAYARDRPAVRRPADARAAGQGLDRARTASSRPGRRLLLEQLEEKGSLAGTYPYPVQAWQLGHGPDVGGAGRRGGGRLLAAAEEGAGRRAARGWRATRTT